MAGFQRLSGFHAFRLGQDGEDAPVYNPGDLLLLEDDVSYLLNENGVDRIILE